MFIVFPNNISFISFLRHHPSLDAHFPHLLYYKLLESMWFLWWTASAFNPATSFFASMQKSQIYTWLGRQSDRWTKLELKIELPRDTLLCVEIVPELKGEVGDLQRCFLSKMFLLCFLP